MLNVQRSMLNAQQKYFKYFSLLRMPEIHKYLPKVIPVFFNAVIHLFDFFLVEKPQHFLFQLTAALAGNDFHPVNAAINGFFHNVAQGFINLIAFIKNLVKV